MFSQEDKINILIIRFKRIGDAILTLPLCNSLKKTFPNASVDYVLYEEMAHLFYNHPYIDNVITIKDEERKNIFKYIKKVYNITRKKYDIIIDVMSTPKSELFCLFSLKSPLRIGRYKKWRGYTYTHKMKEPESLNKVDKFLKQLLSPISDIGFNLNLSYDFKFSASDEEKEKYKKIIQAAGVDFSKPIIAFSIYSRVQHKIYPIEKMKKVVNYLIDKYDAQVIFFFSPEQKIAIQNIHKEMGENKNIFSNIETPTIRELIPFLENCDFYIGNEGGARHLAQGIDLPSLAIFSPSSELKEWLPFPNHKNMGLSPYSVSLEFNMSNEDFIKLSTEEKFNLISVDIICNKIDQLFENNKRK
ncbi:MAG: glycosyltransferase family 9 protein [Fusobacterium sp.]|uniref:glycosyltransferase family 9 protein n=1 Tax=Fusobacterium sp. TaxID=68766 RepID=UPI0026DD3D19|nr:glycosyltransferase family 9 protein [Fusobacterium sp.]MDO4690906.1 glycosyltransferase family 9 protein [Fusobacterium sp.]